MLATIVPYFLLASISDKSAWPNGPEFKFDSNVQIDLDGINGTHQISGFNITNEFTCRPKTDTSLQCQFEHKKLIVFDKNKETGHVTSNEMPEDAGVFKPFSFGIGFNKKGVNKIIINEPLSKRNEAVDIAKAMASALNVGTDLSEVKLGADSTDLGNIQNIVLNKCTGKLTANMQPSSEDTSSKDAEWDLELIPPLEKLAGRNLNVMKNFNFPDCKARNQFFWMGTFITVDKDQDRSHETTVNLRDVGDRITISRGSLDYESVINMDVTLTRKIAEKPEEKKLGMKEYSGIHLVGVQPAVGAWEDIENPVTIDLNEEK